MEQNYDLTRFKKAAEDFILCLKPHADRATVVGLYGDLGAGKTTFTQAAAKALGVTEILNSPTFLIVKSYKLKVQSLQALIHVDAYRLTSSDELKKLRFGELLSDPHNLILVEWADKVADLLPMDHVQLHFEFVDDTTRKISST